MDADDDKAALLAAMRQQADQEKRQILDQAQTQVREIRAQGEAQVRTLREEAQREVDERVRAKGEHIQAETESDERSELLAVKRRLLQEAFDQAGQQLASSGEADTYRACIEALIEQAVKAVGSNVCVTVAPRDKSLCEGVLARLGVTGSVQTDGRTGTVIVTAQESKRRADNSLATRLTRAESLLQTEVARILFDVSTAGDAPS